MATAFKIGIQLYGIQDVFGRDMAGTLRSLAAFGYQGVELIPPYESSADSLAPLLRALGMEAFGFYAFKPQELLEVRHATYGRLKQLGVRHVSAGYAEKVASQWPSAIEEVNRIANAVRGQGLTLDYHNHAQELQLLQGRPALALLAEQSAESGTQFEIDTHFVLKAGEDPCSWIDKLSGRMTRLHLKDINLGDGSVPVFGEGDLDARAVLAAARRAAIEWLVVEFHPGLADPLEMARLCLAGVRESLAT